MKNFKYILALAAIAPVLALAETTVPLIADAGDGVTDENIVGKVIVSNDSTDLTIKYEISNAYLAGLKPVDNDGRWCITEVETDAEDTVDGIPTTSKGLPKIGLFSEKGEYECVSSVEQIFPIPSNDGTVTIGAHAVVRQMIAVPDYLAVESNIKLPQEVNNLRVAIGSDTYISAVIESNDDLDGPYPHSWCIDPKHHIAGYKDYSPVIAVSSYDSNLQDGGLYHEYITQGDPAHIVYPENLPQVNYVINQFDAHVYDGYENTRCQVQQALWVITNGIYGADTDCDGWSIDNLDDTDAVEAIVADAALNGADFKPGCDEAMVVVLLGDPREGSTTGSLQTTIVHIPTPCKETWGEETAWGGNYDVETGMTIDRFAPNNWSMHFEHTITQ